MSLGIGLGAFMSGLQGGLAARERIDTQRETRANKKALKAIDTDAKDRYAEAKTFNDPSGGVDPQQDYQSFWMQYALPKRKAELLRQGDVAGAAALEEWGRSDAALKGGKLFSSALFKAQTGDAKGALADAIKAGQTKGYIEHGYEVLSEDEIRDPQGNTLGFRLRVKGPDGKEIMQDIAVGDVGKVVATFANPDAAWQSQVATRADQAKRAQEMQDYETKKGIDKKYDTGKEKDFEKQYMDAKKARLENDFDFAKMTPEEQDAAIRSDLESAQEYSRGRGGAARDAGAPAGAGGAAPVAPPASRPQMIVDETTGEAIPVPTRSTAPGGPAGPAPGLGGNRVERRPLEAPGLGASPGFNQTIRDRLDQIPATNARGQTGGIDPWRNPWDTIRGAVSRLQSGNGESARPATTRKPGKQPTLHPAQQEMLTMAPQALAAGDRPERVAQQLLNNGVPPEMWPAELTAAMQKTQGAVGLGAR